MSKFWDTPGVNSNVASHFDVVELYTRTIPFKRAGGKLTSVKSPKEISLVPANDETTLIAF
jgi:hypothetical protein